MKKLIFVVSFVVLSGFLFGLSATDAKAATVAELQAQIQQLMAKIAALQQQLSQLQPKPIDWCYTFNVNLKIGDRGSEVNALVMALTKEGFITAEERGLHDIYEFNERVASAAVGFQEKYASEILTPWRLARGTGYVGPSTRAKLNKLYGCRLTCQTLWWHDNNHQYCQQKQFCGAYMYPGLSTFQTKEECEVNLKKPSITSITVMSPNGGEKWAFGVPQTIKWTSSGIASGKTVGLYLMAANNLMCHIANADALSGIYTITLKENQSCSNPYFPNLVAGQYKVFIDAAAATGIENLGDSSDNYFSIIAATTTCTDSDGGLNYYQKGTVTYGSTVNTDTCSTSGYLFEQYCINDKPAQATYWCSYGCKDGACYYQKITNISGQKNSYQTRETINLVIKGITVDGIPASPADGWHVQYYTYNVNDPDNYLKEYVSSGNYNANYSNGNWHANYWAPSTGGSYFTEVVLYCSKEGSKCWNILGRNGLEWKEKIHFSVVDSGEILVPGHDFYVKTSDTGTGNWSFAKDACQALGSGWTLPTMTQLRTLYQKKNEIGGFKDTAYWSSDMGMYISFSNGFESSMNPAMTFPSFRCVKKADGLGLKVIENQLASLSEAVSSLIEQLKTLMGR